MQNNKSKKQNKQSNKSTELNPRQEAFCHYYVETHNGADSARRAGYSPKTADATASRMLRMSNVAKKIAELTKEQQTASIATAQEVMEYLTKVMNGEIKDQFGLDAPLSERTKAAQELAKRTVDVEQRAKGTADAKIEIKLDWGAED